jgi:hypothetical protein
MNPFNKNTQFAAIQGFQISKAQTVTKIQDQYGLKVQWADRPQFHASGHLSRMGYSSMHGVHLLCGSAVIAGSHSFLFPEPPCHAFGSALSDRFQVASGGTDNTPDEQNVVNSDPGYSVWKWRNLPRHD